MKKILKALLALLVITGMTAIVEAAPLQLKKKSNPFKADLRKIEKAEKKIEEAEADDESSSKIKKMEEKLEKMKEKLAKKKQRLQERTEKELAALSAKLEKEKSKETPNERNVAKLEEQIKEKESFLKNLSAWAKGEDPEGSDDEKSDDE